MTQNDMVPDIIITIGGQTGDYPIFGTLSGSLGGAEHWRVCEDGMLVDTYCHLTKVFECPFDFFFDRLSKEKTNNHSYYNTWKELNERLTRDNEIPFSNLYAAQILAPLIPKNSYLNFAILNSLRSWSFFDLDNSVKCFSNVAAFGIDGCNSMLIGESVNTDELCFMITGDLAFFYDMNALGIRHIKNNVRILLVNNHGGAEFRFMTRTWKYKHDVGPFTSAEGHNGQNARGWAENCGFKYFSASSKEEFKKNVNEFISEGEKSIVFELFTKPDEELLAWETLLDHNKMTTPKSTLKSVVANVLGEDGVKMVKGLLKK
jgi:2-succinyl-5-enolpyruvyl-6-hydroxy-3-cyclohexene-1-carboxylate synthase